MTSDAPASPSRSGRRAYRSPAAWLTLLLVLTAALSADLYTKAWSFRTIGNEPVVLDRRQLVADPGHDPTSFSHARTALPFGLLDFKLVLNPGAVFGIGANQRWFFIVFTCLAILVGLHVFGRYTRSGNHLAHVAIGLVLAGGLGNLYDRIVFGRVRDFLHALPGRRLPYDWTWPGTNNPELFPWVFNIADIALLVGMALLMIHINGRERLRKAAGTKTPLDRKDEESETVRT